MVNQNKYIFDQNKEYLPNTHIHVFEVLRTWPIKINIFLIKIKNTFQIRVFMYLRYLDMLNKNIFDQNKEYLPNTPIHVFEVLRTWSTKINIFLIKIKNTFQIRVFMYLRYLDMLNKNIFSKIEITSQIRVFMYLRYSEHGQPK